jgi:hypothetical protein
MTTIYVLLGLYDAATWKVIFVKSTLAEIKAEHDDLVKHGAERGYLSVYASKAKTSAEHQANVQRQIAHLQREVPNGHLG